MNPAGSFSVYSDTVGARRVLKYIYFPTTNTGYRYNYSEPYGAIREIQQLRGMTVSTTDPNQTGAVTSDGQIAANSVYDYPATPMNLDDAPMYETRADDWAGRASAQPVYRFSANQDAGLTSVTAPDGAVTKTYTVTNASAWNYGMVDRVEVKGGVSPTAPTIAKTVYAWQQGAGGQNQRLEKIEFTNEANQTRTVVYGGYDAYNNVGFISEHDFAASGNVGPELRRTEFTYETGSGWINRRLVHLPKTVKVVVSSSVVSQTDYEYDNNGANAAQNLLERQALVMYDITHDPFAEPTVPPCEDPPCSPIPVYDPNTRFRGNVTKVTAYANPSLGQSDPNKSVQTMKYDVPGNLVEQTVNCCRKMTFAYNKTYEYAFPISSSRGDVGQLTTSATYDFNTGFIKTATDENNQTTQYQYDSVSLRQTRVDRPDGGWTTTEYYDSLINGPSGRMYSYVKTTTALDAARSVSNWTYYDGRGTAVRSFGPLTAQGHAGVKDIEFDEMGRVLRASEAYYATNAQSPINPTGHWTSVSYDQFGRATTVTLPDNTTIQTSYNGSVTTVTDQAGRQRRQTTDALGRVIRVDEPDASGNLGDVSAPVQPSFYEYDALNNLTKVTQSANGITQERVFKYDALSRLTNERQPEMNATLNDAGQKVSSGGLWSGVYVYDSNSLLIDGFDARGVNTHFTYDGLNRAKTVVFTGETNYQTPSVTYNYDEERTGYFNKGGLTSVVTAATASAPSTSQVYDYDKMGRVVKQQQTIGANGTIATQVYALEYGYNLAGQLITQKYPSGRAINYSVDEAGRLTNVFGGGRTYANGFSYAGHGGLLSFVYGNGATESFGYNERLQLTQQSLIKDSQVIQRYDYAYGAVDQQTGNVDLSKNTGQLARIDAYIGGSVSNPDKQWQQRFSYDSIGRLSQASEYRSDNNVLSQSYRMQFDYDRWGNRYRKAASNSQSLPFTPIEDADINKATNRFSSSTNTTYDEAGNITTDNKFRNLSYRCDANGRQVWAQNSDGQGSENKAVYDAGGNRVATLVNGQWRYYVYDIGGNLLAEYGQPQITTENIRYYMQDRQASTRVVMNQSGSVISRTDYQAFGEEIGAGVGRRTTSQGYGQTDSNRQRYAMTERDEATALDHTWFRKYDNKAGRWTSPDPYKGSMSVSNPQSFNRYAYVENDPVNLIDPSGLRWVEICSWWALFDVTNPDNPIQISDPYLRCSRYWVPDYMPVGGAPPPPAGEGAGAGAAPGPEGNGIFDDAYRECLSSLGTAPAPGLSKTASIIQVANTTGVDRTLLTVTWLGESGFEERPPNGSHGPNELIGDIGPGQLFPGIWAKSPYTDGLTNPFGTNREVGQVFNGNVLENLILTARALNSRDGTRAEKAGLYRAGSTTGPGYQDRVDQFNKYAKGYGAFYDCLAKKGF